VFTRISYLIGALGAIWFVGFLAYKIEKLPLTIIVICCLALMIYSFYDDMRNDRAVAQARSDNSNSR
jgi:4-hydroxybenzoate polyprenyltransferase